MFDSVLLRGSLPKSRLGAGASITVAVHVVVLAVVVYLSSRPPPVEEKESEVKFFAAPPPPPPPPPPPAGSTTPKVEKKVEKKKPKPTEIVQPKEIPQEKPPEAEPEPEQAASEPEPAGQVGGVEGGVEGGVVGGQVGGTVGGVLGGTGSSTEVMAFGEGMTRPEFIKTPPSFICPREAIEAKIDSTMLASCTVGLDGYLKNCRIIKPVPFMETVALELLAKWRVGPVFFQGQPVLVNYKIPLHFVCK